VRHPPDEVDAVSRPCYIRPRTWSLFREATFEYEVEASGIVGAIYAPAKSTVPVGYVIAFIGEPGEEPPEGIEGHNSALLGEHRRQSELEIDLDIDLAAKRDAPAARPRRSRIRATPAAHRLARSAKVKIEDVAGALSTEGVVTEDDVQRYLQMGNRQ